MAPCKVLVYLLIFTLSINSTTAQTVTGPLGEVFSVRVVKDHLSDAWEITYGPDNQLWVTESKAYLLSRINPENGKKTVLLDLSSQKDFPRYDKIPDEIDGGKPWPQGGLTGLALHPKLLAGSPYVYLSYVYHFAGAGSKGDGNAPNYSGYFFTTRLVRYEYDIKAQKLINPLVLCDTIPNSSDHNSGRLLIAPVNGKNFLFYTIGDLGAGQFGNSGRKNFAQSLQKYEGKILRFNIEPDTDKNDYDKWIPNDNPVNTSRQSAIWSYGHRNAQGLAYAVVGDTGRLYSSEHGPYSDDEINIIEKGKNYGHPLIIGFNDNNYNGLAAGASNYITIPGKWHSSYPLIVSENNNAALLGSDYRNPIKTLYPSDNTFLTTIITAITNGKRLKWESEAPSSLDVYTSSAIPGWKNSLLLPTLKGGKLVRLKLNPGGNSITGDTINYFKDKVRYRDVAISNDGTKIYLAVDSSETSSGPSQLNKMEINHNGCILEFTYIKGGETMGKASTDQQPGDDRKKFLSARIK